MRNFIKMALAVLALALMAQGASAQTAPWNNPTYIPTVQAPQTTFTATGDYTFATSGMATVSFRFSSLSGTLVAAIQGTNDGTNWTTLQANTVGATTISTSISANGFYTVNSAGMTSVRVHITTLSSASHTVKVQGAGTLSANNLLINNPTAISGPVSIVDGVGGINPAEVTAGNAASTNLKQVAGASVATGHGTAAGTIRVELPTDGTGLVNAARVSDYPAGSTPLTASATGTTGATTATLAGTSAKTTYLCGFSIMTSANAATVVAPTVTGVITATLTMSQYVAVNTAGVSELKREFDHCVPASGTNQAIAVVSGAAGTGGVTAVNAWGYQL